MRVNFVTVDVFTEKPFGGNPLAVILDAEGLSSEQMQAIAAELNLSETTFVLPPKDPHHTAQVRIFTPRAELPFAGHPNVGTAFALARAGECYGKELTGETLIFEELAGLVSIELLKNGNIVSGAKLAAPQPLSTSDEILPQIVAAATSLEENQIETANHAPLIASCGTPLIFAEIKDRAALAAAQPNTDVFNEHFPIARAIGLHLYTHVQGEDVDIQTRMFAPLLGILEDPATGGANVTLIGLLAQLRSEPDLRVSQRIAQGVDMGRPSLMEATAEKKDSNVTATFIGGSCVPMMSGHLDL